MHDRVRLRLRLLSIAETPKRQVAVGRVHLNSVVARIGSHDAPAGVHGETTPDALLTVMGARRIDRVRPAQAIVPDRSGQSSSEQRSHQDRGQRGRARDPVFPDRSGSGLAHEHALVRAAHRDGEGPRQVLDASDHTAVHAEERERVRSVCDPDAQVARGYP
jgi:hypothetical protein